MVADLDTLSSISEYSRNSVLVLFLFACLLLSGCLADDKTSDRLPGLQNDGTAEPADAWSILMSRKAYPFTTPLPQTEKTPIDGTYVKFDSKITTPIPCRLCPDYMNEGGIWRLSFDKGTFRVLHLVTGWTGIGSYSIGGDRLVLFNDPKCLSETGVYKWRQINSDLVLETILDHCAADMRNHNLEQMVWRNCASKPSFWEDENASPQQEVCPG